MSRGEAWAEPALQGVAAFVHLSIQLCRRAAAFVHPSGLWGQVGHPCLSIQLCRRAIASVHPSVHLCGRVATPVRLSGLWGRAGRPGSHGAKPLVVSGCPRGRPLCPGQGCQPSFVPTCPSGVRLPWGPTNTETGTGDLSMWPPPWGSMQGGQVEHLKIKEAQLNLNSDQQSESTMFWSDQRWVRGVRSMKFGSRYSP